MILFSPEFIYLLSRIAGGVFVVSGSGTVVVSFFLGTVSWLTDTDAVVTVPLFDDAANAIAENAMPHAKSTFFMLSVLC